MVIILMLKLMATKDLPAIIFSNSLGTDMRMWDCSNKSINRQILH